MNGFYSHKMLISLRQHAGLCLTLLLLLCLSGLFGLLLSGEYTLYYRDIYHNYEPQLAYLKQVLAQGELPLWHTGINGGTPFLPGLEPPLLYPGTWLFMMGLSFPVALGLNLLLHHLLAGLGMYWLGRQFSLHPLSAGLAALAFSLSGTLLSMNNLYPLMNTVAWLPLLLGLVQRLLQAPRGRVSAALGAVYGLQILSGHLEIVFFESLLILAYVLYALKDRLTASDPLDRKILGWGCLAVITGLLLGAIQFLPTLYFVGISARNAAIETELALVWSWHPLLFSLLLLPELHGGSMHPGSLHAVFGEPTYGFEPLFFNIYAGIPIVILALLAVLNWKHHPHKACLRFCLVALLGSFVLAAGRYTPIYGLLYEYFPGMGFFRYPSKWLVFSSFFMALLGGLGLESLLKQSASKKALALSCGSLLLALGSLFVMIHSTALNAWVTSYRSALPPPQQAQVLNLLTQQLNLQVLYALALLLLSGGLLWWWQHTRQALSLGLLGLLLLIDLTGNGLRLLWLSERQAFDKQPAAVELLAQVRAQDQSSASDQRLLVASINAHPEGFRTDLHAQPGLRQTLYTYEALIRDLPLRWQEHVVFTGWPAKTRVMDMLSELYTGAYAHNQPQTRQRLETVMAVRYLLLANPPAEEVKRLKQTGLYTLRAEQAESGLSLWEKRNWQPRVRFLTQAALAPSQDMALKTLIFPESGFDPVKQVVLEQSADLQAQLQAIPPQIPKQPHWSKPQITHESNQQLELAFDTNQSGYLVLADQWTPGWQAWLNGKEVPILRANGFQRAIRLGPGQHQIRFEYTLPGFAAGTLLTALGLLLLLVLWFWPYQPTAFKEAAAVSET